MLIRVRGSSEATSTLNSAGDWMRARTHTHTHLQREQVLHKAVRVAGAGQSSKRAHLAVGALRAAPVNVV